MMNELRGARRRPVNTQVLSVDELFVYGIAKQSLRSRGDPWVRSVTSARQTQSTAPIAGTQESQGACLEDALAARDREPVRLGAHVEALEDLRLLAAELEDPGARAGTTAETGLLPPPHGQVVLEHVCQDVVDVDGTGLELRRD